MKKEEEKKGKDVKAMKQKLLIMEFTDCLGIEKCA